MGIIVGALLGLVVGGMVAEHYGWRMAFIAAGVPGVFLALLVFLTVKEPMRGQSDEHHTASAELSFFESFSALWENRVYRYVTAAHVFAVFYGYAISSWLPALFLRQWDVSQGEVGGIVGLIFFAGGIPGLLGGGLLATYLAKRDPRWEAWVPAIAVLCAIPMYLLGLRSESILAASIFFGFGTFFFQFSHGPGMAVIQSSVAPNRRAFAAAVMFFASNMLGLGLGPFLVGMISDWRLADSDGGALAVALALTSFSLVFATVGYWYGGVLWGKVSQNAPVRKPSS
jgi:predicted MFS family arabinose efflux permease